MNRTIVTLLLLLTPGLALAQQADQFFQPVNHLGAFGGGNWLEGWTALSEKGYLTPPVSGTNLVQITDSDIGPGQDVVWTANNQYRLNGVVFVEDGASLTIEPGTVIYGAAGQGNAASALVVARGGKLYAEGTAVNPIIFTADGDDGTLTYQDRGLWGGIVLLGRAATNNQPDGIKQVEGINEIAGAGDDRATYGGTDDNDSSGIMRFVSIRHTGINVGDQAGNEIQGLTLGAVGRGTVIEYVESFASADDGFEWFGGTVDANYLVSAFNEDDSFDWDEGYRGRGQFWFAIQATDVGGRVAEMDGATGNEFFEPYAHPVLSNVTYVGTSGGLTAGDGAEMLMFRDNTGGEYHNSIFQNYDAASGGLAITVEDIDNGGSKPADSRQRLENGDIVLANNLWSGFAAGTSVAAIAPQDFVQTMLGANNNALVDPQLRGLDRDDPDGSLDPRPAAGSPAWTGAVPVTGGYFSPVSYRGAFGTANWLEGWTALSEKGYVAGTAAPSSTIEVTDATIGAGQTVVWTPDNSYRLNGVVFVEDGATLIIEAGTTVYGAAGQGNAASALVVARGGKLIAEGTPSNPIIFTADGDDGTLTYQDRGLWGGIVLLGRAITNNQPDGTKQVEGVNEIAGAGDDRATYGGTDDGDSSGILRYVSIRHTGINVGDQAGNEIQGLTLGGVGSGTVIEYVESFASADDGFEWFGGAVNTRNLVSAFNEDDSYDWDEGFRGKGQFWFAIQATDVGGRVAEMDGATGNEFFEPYAHPILSNVTYLGTAGGLTAGDGAEMLMFRDNTAGEYHNSIFQDYDAASGGLAITVEDIDNAGSKPADSRQRLENGEIVLANNMWFNFAAGASLPAFAPQDFVQTILAANGNQVADPMLRGINRDEPAAGLDPRPMTGSPALRGAQAVTTAIEAYSQDVPEGFVLDQNYPNPFNPATTISFSLDQTQSINLAVFDMLGRRVAMLLSGVQAAGAYRVPFDAAALSSGMYLYRLDTVTGSIARTMILVK
ncbi:MAG: hypothetical protein ACI80V_002150 [Rhodothermales bacterium]|jgi:hypothetical protein